MACFYRIIFLYSILLNLFPVAMFTNKLMNVLQSSTNISNKINLVYRINKCHMSQLLAKGRSNQLQDIQLHKPYKSYTTLCPRAQLINRTRICLVLLPLTSVCCSAHTSGNLKAAENNDVSNFRMHSDISMSFIYNK